MSVSNTVVKTTSVPVVIQINGVNLPSFDDIKSRARRGGI